MLSQAATPATGLGDLCPLVPAACVVPDEVIDTVNPFKSFWDAFFVSSPQEALETPLRMIMSVPQPKFNAAWFEEAYGNTLAYYGIGIAIIMVMVSMLFSLLPNNSARTVLDGFIDFVVTLFQIAFLPVFSAAVLLVSSAGMKAVLGWVDIQNPKDYMVFFNANYFEVGWMSLVIRAIGILLALEVVAIYLIQIVATLAGAIIIPLRGVGEAGRMWYVRMIRGILLGFAPLIMAFVLAAFILVLNKAQTVGSVSFFQFAGATAGVVVAGIAPLKMAKKSRTVVTNAALKMAEVRFRPSDSMQNVMTESASTASLNNFLAQRKAKQSARFDFVKDTASVGFAAYTGGAATALMALGSSRSRTGARTAAAFRRTQSMTQSIRNRKGGNSDNSN